MEIFGLTYVSSAHGLYDQEIYRDVAVRSQPFNADHAITGILLVYNETIIQFLEGPKSEVWDLYRRIEQDSRHRNPILISTNDLDEREFPDWSMGYQEITELADPKYLFSLNLKSLGMHFPRNASKVTDALLDSFKRSSGMIWE